MRKMDLPDGDKIYETECPILYAMKLIGHKWKLPILWYLAAAKEGKLRFRDLAGKVVGISPTMLTKCLRELEEDDLIRREQLSTIPPTVEYSLKERARTLLPSLEALYNWADEDMRKNRKA